VNHSGPADGTRQVKASPLGSPAAMPDSKVYALGTHIGAPGPASWKSARRNIDGKGVLTS
jgi:hypothetical protein